MKTFLFGSIIIILNLYALNAQDTISKPKIYYRSWVQLMGDTNKIKGFLYTTEDSSIILTESIWFLNKLKLAICYDFSDIPFNEINVLSVRNYGSSGTGLLVGTLSGVILGCLIGYTHVNKSGSLNFTPGTNALIYSIFFTPIGGIIGLIVGSIKIKMHVNGDYKNFNGYRNRLNKYSIKNQDLLNK